MADAAPLIRVVTTEDHDAILGVVEGAFTNDGRDGSEELDIVRRTWASSARLGDLEFVATAEGRVVGHVLVAQGSLSGRPVPGVAPLAVAPTHQGLGIGAGLMTRLIGQADVAGLPMLLLLGSDTYYPRFGFEPAAPLGIVYPPAGPTSPHFQARRLTRFDPSLRGTYAYCWEL